ncbi:MAG: hypothetical protein AAF368_13470, partial [Planctomycetota bacterium]
MDLGERFRQLSLFDQAEVVLVRALVDRPQRLETRHARVLRRSLNLARLWVIEADGVDIPVGPHLGDFRDAVRPLAHELLAVKRPDPAHFGPHARRLAEPLQQARRQVLSRHLTRISSTQLDLEIGQKKLALAVGGGGG